MTEKRERPEDQPEKEDKFTGTPGQQLPDLEAEDKQDRQEEQFEEEAGTDKDE